MLRILMGIIIGSVLALTLPGQGVVSMLGDLFVGALKGIAPVLVFVLVAASVSKARNGLGSRFKSVVMLYLLSTLVAAVVAVLVSFLFPVTIALTDTPDASNAAPGAVSEVLQNIVRKFVCNPI